MSQIFWVVQLSICKRIKSSRKAIDEKLKTNSDEIIRGFPVAIPAFGEGHRMSRGHITRRTLP